MKKEIQCVQVHLKSAVKSIENNEKHFKSMTNHCKIQEKMCLFYFIGAGMSYLVSFVNTGARIASSNENFLLCCAEEIAKRAVKGIFRRSHTRNFTIGTVRKKSQNSFFSIFCQASYVSQFTVAWRLINSEIARPNNVPDRASNGKAESIWERVRYVKRFNFEASKFQVLSCFNRD